MAEKRGPISPVSNSPAREARNLASTAATLAGSIEVGRGEVTVSGPGLHEADGLLDRVVNVLRALASATRSSIGQTLDEAKALVKRAKEVVKEIAGEPKVLVDQLRQLFNGKIVEDCRKMSELLATLPA